MMLLLLILLCPFKIQKMDPEEIDLQPDIDLEPDIQEAQKTKDIQEPKDQRYPKTKDIQKTKIMAFSKPNLNKLESKKKEQ